MSLLFGLLLVAISWLLSAFIGGIPHLWHLFAIAPLWLTGTLVAAVLALLLSDP